MCFLRIREIRILIFPVYFNIQNKKDPTALLSIGNFYMHSYDGKRADETTFRISYKYYFSLLQEHVRNMYASNGLGILCSKKGENLAGYQIFAKVSYVTIVFLNHDFSYAQLLKKNR